MRECVIKLPELLYQNSFLTIHKMIYKTSADRPMFIGSDLFVVNT